MKCLVKAAVMSVVLVGSSSALADCPVALPFENLMDCMVEEGAGGEYPSAKVLKELNESQAEGKQTQYIDDGRSADEV